jgi:MarR family transcriptional regulator, organic hydroperoxide resistance regulator
VVAVKEKIKEIEQCFLEFFPLYYERFSGIFREDGGQDCRISKNQKRAIILIKKRSGLTPTELGRFLDMRKGSLTTLLDALDTLGLVERRTDPSDRRKVLLSLTETGNQYYEEMMGRHERLFCETFGRLGEDELDQCLTGIKNVVASIKKTGGVTW